MLSELPSYLTDELGFDTSMAGLMTVAPYIALLISNFAFSEIFRWLQERWQWGARPVRQVAQLISFMGSSIFLLGCAFTRNQTAGLVFMILAQACLGANNAGLGCAYLDLAPRFSGNFNSCGNSIAAVAGIAGPLVVSSLISSYGTDEGWKLSFYLTTAISTIASLAWICFQKSEIDMVLNSPSGRKWK